MRASRVVGSRFFGRGASSGSSAQPSRRGGFWFWAAATGLFAVGSKAWRRTVATVEVEQTVQEALDLDATGAVSAQSTLKTTLPISPEDAPVGVPRVFPLQLSDGRRLNVCVLRGSPSPDAPVIVINAGTIAAARALQVELARSLGAVVVAYTHAGLSVPLRPEPATNGVGPFSLSTHFQCRDGSLFGALSWVVQMMVESRFLESVSGAKGDASSGPLPAARLASSLWAPPPSLGEVEVTSEAQSQELSALLSHLGAESATLLSTHFNYAATLKTALRNPTRVTGVVLLDPFLPAQSTAARVSEYLAFPPDLKRAAAGGAPPAGAAEVSVGPSGRPVFPPELRQQLAARYNALTPAPLAPLALVAPPKHWVAAALPQGTLGEGHSKGGSRRGHHGDSGSGHHHHPPRDVPAGAEGQAGLALDASLSPVAFTGADIATSIWYRHAVAGSRLDATGGVLPPSDWLARSWSSQPGGHWSSSALAADRIIRHLQSTGPKLPAAVKDAVGGAPGSANAAAAAGMLQLTAASLRKRELSAQYCPHLDVDRDVGLSALGAAPGGMTEDMAARWGWYTLQAARWGAEAFPPGTGPAPALEATAGAKPASSDKGASRFNSGLGLAMKNDASATNAAFGALLEPFPELRGWTPSLDTRLEYAYQSLEALKWEHFLCEAIDGAAAVWGAAQAGLATPAAQGAVATKLQAAGVQQPKDAATLTAAHILTLLDAQPGTPPASHSAAATGAYADAVLRFCLARAAAATELGLSPLAATPAAAASLDAKTRAILAAADALAAPPAASSGLVNAVPRSSSAGRGPFRPRAPTTAAALPVSTYAEALSALSWRSRTLEPARNAYEPHNYRVDFRGLRSLWLALDAAADGGHLPAAPGPAHAARLAALHEASLSVGAHRKPWLTALAHTDPEAPSGLLRWVAANIAPAGAEEGKATAARGKGRLGGLFGSAASSSSSTNGRPGAPTTAGAPFPVLALTTFQTGDRSSEPVFGPPVTQVSSTWRLGLASDTVISSVDGMGLAPPGFEAGISGLLSAAVGGGGSERGGLGRLPPPVAAARALLKLEQMRTGEEWSRALGARGVIVAHAESAVQVAARTKGLTEPLRGKGHPASLLITADSGRWYSLGLVRASADITVGGALKEGPDGTVVGGGKKVESRVSPGAAHLATPATGAAPAAPSAAAPSIIPPALTGGALPFAVTGNLSNDPFTIIGDVHAYGGPQPYRPDAAYVSGAVARLLQARGGKTTSV